MESHDGVVSLFGLAEFAKWPVEFHTKPESL